MTQFGDGLLNCAGVAVLNAASKEMMRRLRCMTIVSEEMNAM